MTRAALARSALRRARRVLSSVDPDDPGGDVCELFGACREAVYFALTITNGEATIAGAWRTADPAILGADSEPWRHVFTEDGYLALADGGPAAWKTAGDGLAFAAALVARCDPQGELLLRARRQRLLRVAAAIAAAVATAWGTWWVARGPDLARGKTWRASSAFDGYVTTGTDQQASDVGVFFHTAHEGGPWVEVDLGADTEISEVTLGNREDVDPAIAARAVPLVVEVRSSSSDAWTELARQDLVFTTWSARGHGVRGQVVRVRALRSTWLHLQQIEIH